MSERSTRLLRVLRKFALDRRLALQAQARAEMHRRALHQTEHRLVSARDALATEHKLASARELGARMEWRERLDAAQHSLQPAMRQSQSECVTASNITMLAKGREETLERIYDEAALRDAQNRERRIIENLQQVQRRRGTLK